MSDKIVFWGMLVLTAIAALVSGSANAQWLAVVRHYDAQGNEHSITINYADVRTYKPLATREQCEAYKARLQAENTLPPGWSRRIECTTQEPDTAPKQRSEMQDRGSTLQRLALSSAPGRPLPAYDVSGFEVLGDPAGHAQSELYQKQRSQSAKPVVAHVTPAAGAGLMVSPPARDPAFIRTASSEGLRVGSARAMQSRKCQAKAEMAASGFLERYRGSPMMVKWQKENVTPDVPNDAIHIRDDGESAEEKANIEAVVYSGWKAADKAIAEGIKEMPDIDEIFNQLVMRCMMGSET